jgi:diaminohydroxyphosphoribosylaminopyrimidine deaminase / 5-amino-6-(5-phosphoribosylamino)uracil reductase
MADGHPAHQQGAAQEAHPGASSWPAIPRIFRTPAALLPQPWQDIFGPLREGAIDDIVLVGQCGQSIDARIATPGGDSHYINGPAGLDHLHRLRALVDAVVIGVGTAVTDDPQLTVRRVAGPNPARVIIDPSGRLPVDARVLAPDGAQRIVVSLAGVPVQAPPGVDIVALAPDDQGRLAPAAIACALAKQGLRRILIEGGSETVSRFFAARCLDRLHVLLAPIILGAGRASLRLPPLHRIRDANRMPMRVHILDAMPSASGNATTINVAANGKGPDVLLDCDLSDQRVVIGRAKKSL